MSENKPMRFPYEFLKDAFSALMTDVNNLSNPSPYIIQFTSKCKLTRQLKNRQISNLRKPTG